PCHRRTPKLSRVYTAGDARQLCGQRQDSARGNYLNIFGNIFPVASTISMEKIHDAPTPEEENIVLVAVATLRKAKRFIESCEHSNPDLAETPFDHMLRSKRDGLHS